MTVAEWQAVIGLVLGVAAVAGIIFTVLRFYIRAFARQELEDIRHELKPNGGSSIKDQVTRLENDIKSLKKDQKSLEEAHKETHESLKEQGANITKIYDTLLAYVTRNDK